MIYIKPLSKNKCGQAWHNSHKREQIENAACFFGRLDFHFNRILPRPAPNASGHPLALNFQALHPVDKNWMATTMVKCPFTEFNVQYRMDGNEDVPENEYEAVTCQACARLHLVNRKTGKLLGQEEE